MQDYLFLIHFSRAWALAVTKAETVAEMRQCAATVNALVNDEIALHVETCAGEGLDEADLRGAEEAPETLAYTRYVLDAGHSGDFLDLMAALAPCVLGYGEIGARLAPRTGAGSPLSRLDRDLWRRGLPGGSRARRGDDRRGGGRRLGARPEAEPALARRSAAGSGWRPGSRRVLAGRGSRP